MVNLGYYRTSAMFDTLDEAAYYNTFLELVQFSPVGHFDRAMFTHFVHVEYKIIIKCDSTNHQ